MSSYQAYAVIAILFVGCYLAERIAGALDKANDRLDTINNYLSRVAESHRDATVSLSDIEMHTHRAVKDHYKSDAIWRGTPPE